MKRLSLLLISVFLLTLLATPASADDANKKTQTLTSTSEPAEIPVLLSVDASEMVNVTITWDALSFSYNCKTKSFSPGASAAPAITVTNNNPQMTVTALPAFKPDTTLEFGEDDFELNFFENPNETIEHGNAIKKAVSVENGASVIFYVVPSGNPSGNSALIGTARAQSVGTVRVTIGLPESGG